MATFSKNMWKNYRYLVNKHRTFSTIGTNRFIVRPISTLLKDTHNDSHTQLPPNTQQIRHMSDGRRNFLQQFFENLKNEMDKDKRMKDSITKFREEAEKLEKSDSLQSARRRYEEFEKETSTGIKQTLDDVSEKFKEQLEEVKKSELAKKGIEFSEEISKTAKGAAESVSKTTQSITKSGAFQAVSKSIQAVKDEIDETTDAGIYRAPDKLRKRDDLSQTDVNFEGTAKPIEPNTEALGIELHKDSRWYQQWEAFKENNPVVNRVFDWKMKYDESDNVVIRASRFITDKVTDVMGGMFAKTEMSEVLTEIVKVDTSFTKEHFLERCEKEIIPNVLEAMIRGDLDILKDWCHEAPYNVLATPIKQAKTLGYTFHSKVLDIMNVDLLMGKMMEQGPVLIINFQAQQIMVVRNSKGDLVEGTEDDVQRVNYVWVLCRDQTIFDPNAAWKLMDMSAQSTKQFI